MPGYSAGLFRRTDKDLNKPGNILDRARTWFAGTLAEWDNTIHGFRFPTLKNQPDATIHFGYGTTKQEIEDKYQGTEFQFIGVDELPQWSEDTYRYLFSRLRRLRGVPVPLRMRGTGNPGGRGAEWVRKRFVEFAKHVETKAPAREALTLRRQGDALPSPPYFESPPSAEAAVLARELGRRARGALFVPAFASDNPGLDIAEYRLQLVNLDPATRAQLEWGDWWAAGGGDYFKEAWFKYVDEPPPGLRTIRYWDLAGTKPKPGRDPDWSAGVRMGVETLPDGGKRVFITHVSRLREDPGEVEAHVKGIAETDGRNVKIYMEEEPGSAGKNNTHNYARRVLFGWSLEGHRKTGSKEEYWKPLSGAARNGGLYLVRGPWNEEFVRELCALPNGAHDDQADAAAGAFAHLLGSSAADRLRMRLRA